MADVAVTLSGRKITVDKNRVSVSVSKNEKVRWTSTSGAFEIQFKEASHPNPRTTQNGSTWTAESGPFANPNRSLFYSVIAPDHDELDPEVVVEP
jgi:hypothetical protein